MMHPWQGKIKQFRIVLETCPRADALAWLIRGGPIALPDLDIYTTQPQISVQTIHPNSAEEADAKSLEHPEGPPMNVNDEPAGIVALVQQEPLAKSPEQPEDPPMNGNDEPAGVVALVQQEPPWNSNVFPPIGRRRQSVAGGVLFSVENRVVETGGDFLRRMMTGTMILNRFDPFQRMPNGPLRKRSRSVDFFQPMSSIEEVHDDSE